MEVTATTRLLEGRRALVTGARGGIGAAVARAFLAHGADVAGTDIADGDGAPPCDVTDAGAVAQLFEAVGHVDDVVHAVGVMTTGEIATTSEEEFRRVLDVNVVGTFLVARAAARRLRRGATLTLIASQAGRKGGARWGTYCASKFAVVGLGESLAQELAPVGVRVNVLCPGTVDTAMAREAMSRLAEAGGTAVGAVRDRYLAGIPLGRFARADDVADACVLLASPLARYIAGASLVVDGAELS